jgi:hypothetical protein
MRVKNILHGCPRNFKFSAVPMHGFPRFTVWRASQILSIVSAPTESLTVLFLMKDNGSVHKPFRPYLIGRPSSYLSTIFHTIASLHFNHGWIPASSTPTHTDFCCGDIVLCFWEFSTPLAVALSTSVKLHEWLLQTQLAVSWYLLYLVFHGCKVANRLWPLCIYVILDCKLNVPLAPVQYVP